jgi:lipopolysaccharide exporter
MVMCTVLRFGKVMIMARLLAPQDFGMMAIVISVTGFLQVFTDLGVSTAIIHYRDISQSELSSLYWLNVLVGALLMLMLVGASPEISRLIYRKPELEPVLMLMSANFLLLATGQQLRVMAEKTLRFSILAKIDILATVCGGVIAVVWAWRAPSVYPLLADALAVSCVQTALLWLFVAQGWRPDLRLRIREIERFLKFGSYMLGSGFVNHLNRGADILVGGTFFPAAALGVYSLPRNLCLNISGAANSIITRVGFPVMAKAQEDRAFLRSIYLKTLRMTASVNFPIYLALAFFSRDVVLVVFGAKWVSAAPLLVFLAIWGMFRSCGNPSGSLVYAVGKARLGFWWNVAQLCVVFPVAWIASHFGIEGLAVGQVAFMAGLLLPTWYFLIRSSCGARLGEYMMTFLSPLATGFFAVFVGRLAVAHWSTPIWRLAGMALISAPAYLIASWVTNRSWVIAMQQLILRRSEA